MPGLIPISDWHNNLTDDILGSDEQFPVKIFFSKSLIFEISKILIFNPKSLNFNTLWLIYHFFYQTCDQSNNKQMIDDFGYVFW